MEDIEAGLAALTREIRERRIGSIALPPPGSGLGGLDWASVRPRIEAVLGEFDDLKVAVFEPWGGSADRRSKSSPTRVGSLLRTHENI